MKNSFKLRKDSEDPNFLYATEKKDHSVQIYNQLVACYKNIDSTIKNANSKIIINSYLAESVDFEGEYYDFYVQKKNDWVQQVETIKKEFEDFLIDLNSCVLKAEELKEYWLNYIEENKGDV